MLAEWSPAEGPTAWRLVKRRQFTDITGPGGIHGPPSAVAPLWAIGWDEKSVLLMVRCAADAAAGRDPWHTFRLPKACHSYDSDHGWHTEWPRIREVVSEEGGRPAGTAYVWKEESIRAGVPSDPLLLAGGSGYGHRVVHLAHGADSAVTFTIEVGGGDAWQPVAKVIVPAGGHAFHVFPADVRGDWVRVVSDRDAPDATAVFRYGLRGGSEEDANLFAPLADVRSNAPWIGAVVRSGDGESLPLDVLARPVDAATVVLKEGEKVFRLPKPLDAEVAAAYEEPFATGWPRGMREVVTERSLLNAAGTF